MTDEDKVRATTTLYVEGMARGDRDKLATAFHAQACVIRHFDRALEWSSLSQFIGACEAEAIAPSTDIPPFEIEALEVDGDCAAVRVTNYWAGIRFRDWLTLLHHDARWQIVNKVFRVID